MNNQMALTLPGGGPATQGYTYHSLHTELLYNEAISREMIGQKAMFFLCVDLLSGTSPAGWVYSISYHGDAFR